MRSGLSAPILARSAGWLLGAALALPAVADEPGLVSLPDYTVISPMVANQEPVGAAPMPVSVLRFEPLVDLEARNLPETQADVTIRGGIFENTGFKIGALSLYDPQTGHYFAEIPVAPAMLGSPAVLTGEANALAGFDANVGTVAYGWRPIETRGELTLAGGDYGYNRQSVYQGAVLPGSWAGEQAATDLEWSRSQSDGSVPYGDHDFQRVAGRVQLRGAESQTDFFAGYQRKFFGWPNLYTPFGFDETEDLQTVLLAANHRWQDAAGDRLELGAYFRRNRDDYEFDRFIPGLFNPYQTTTWVRGAALDGWQQLDGFALTYSAQFMHDDIRSTSLVFGPFDNRSYLKLALAPEKTFATDTGALTLRGGLTYDNSDRDKSALSPLFRAEWQGRSGPRPYLEYAETSQLPTYTALKSSPTSGLFLGNQSLGRETSRNLEVGLKNKAAAWEVDAAVFYRRDDDLVDWTYQNGVPDARAANPVNIGTAGFELVASHRTKQFDLVLGYTFLHKNADYGNATVDASFYALNFPKQRLTAALTWRVGAGFEIRSDNEFRIEEPNALRTIGGNEAVLSSLGVYYLPPHLHGWEFSVQADNLWDSDFQEVPSVPAARRQYAGSVTRRW